MATLKFRSGSTDWQNVPAIQGEPGEPGVTPNITVQATTLAAGSAATVTKTGTTENPVFTFGIPKGDKGDTGASYTLPQATSSTLGGITVGSNISISSGKISLSSKNVTDALGYTPLQTAPVTSVNGQTGAVTISTSDSTKIPLSGSRGTMAGYNTPASSSSAVTINGSSNDDTIVTAAVAVTVSNGSSGQTWTKTVALQNASATVTLGGSWKWVGGSAPTIKANSILIVKWCGSFGLANLIAGE